MYKTCPSANYPIFLISSAILGTEDCVHLFVLDLSLTFNKNNECVFRARQVLTKEIEEGGSMDDTTWTWGLHHEEVVVIKAECGQLSRDFHIPVCMTVFIKLPQDQKMMETRIPN